MNRLPIEIENKIWSLYYSDIYYTNVISELNTIIKICNQIAVCDVNGGYSPKISLLEFYSKELSKIYEHDELKRRIFQIYFYKKNT